jgi:bifunctional NMN adenylyltransferase/nudix hydrolase
MDGYKYDLAIFIGRFQPFHNGHAQNINKALTLAKNVLVIVGSANQPRTIKNPFTAAERKAMVQEYLGAARLLRVTVDTVEDTIYQETRWVEQVQAAARIVADRVGAESIAIIGYEKDESSYYHRSFPTWDFVDIGAYAEHGGNPIDATKIRELMFEGHVNFVESVMPHSVFRHVVAFTATEDFAQLVKEYRYIQDYRKAWKDTPYPVVFFTVDAVVVQSGHLLLVERRAEPGKGLWALPGGFIDQRERTFDAAVRELKEETRLKVPEAVIRGSCRAAKLFDHPDRSLRGRTITQAYLFELPDQDRLPKVKGGDDAAKARWFPLEEVSRMGDRLFEDHKSIIELMVTRAK